VERGALPGFTREVPSGGSLREYLLRTGGFLAIFAEEVGWRPSFVSCAIGVILVSAGAVFANQTLTML